jgi:hypothetical protein
MTRLAAFVLVRLLALLGVLALSQNAAVIGPYWISILIIIGEAILGFIWGRAESQIELCKPKFPDPHRLWYRMIALGLVESLAAVQVVGRSAVVLIIWRILTAYIPFVLMEVTTFKKACQVKAK